MRTETKSRKAGKRAHGEGTIYFSESRGQWIAQISLEGGKRKSYYGATQAEAKAKRDAGLRQVQQGLAIPNERLTLGKFLADWLESVARGRVRESTFSRYSLDVRHITKAMGTLPMAKLSSQAAQKYLNSLEAIGLSPATIRHRRAVLRSALTTAETWGVIARNPVSGKRVTTPKANKHTVEALTPEQARAVIDAFKGHALEPLVVLALATGIRRGELLGLRWSDVDLPAGVITVRYQLQQADGEWKLVPPKSEEARRTLPLAGNVVELLRNHRVQQLEARLAAGAAWREPLPGLVFTTSVGTPIDGDNVYHRFQQRLADAGLPKMRFHDLRHGAATLMLVYGADLMTIKDQLGHSQISLTANTYAHVLPKLKRDTAERLDAALLGAR